MMKNTYKTIVAILLTTTLMGCNAHNGYTLDNQTKAGILGGVAGGCVGNQFGKGSGNVALTALGAVLGVVAGQSLAKPQEAPAVYNRTVTYQAGRCDGYTNQGARAACQRGVSDRERRAQQQLERDAYNYGRR